MKKFGDGRNVYLINKNGRRNTRKKNLSRKKIC